MTYGSECRTFNKKEKMENRRTESAEVEVVWVDWIGLGMNIYDDIYE